jgi:hypothetical protein
VAKDQKRLDADAQTFWLGIWGSSLSNGAKKTQKGIVPAFCIINYIISMP